MPKLIAQNFIFVHVVSVASVSNLSRVSGGEGGDETGVGVFKLLFRHFHPITFCYEICHQCVLEMKIYHLKPGDLT